MKKIINYIIVVHGIGQQRKNETILPVIEQFAAARHGKSGSQSILTLGRLTSQTRDKLWIEYKNIPNSPDSMLKSPWQPAPVSENDTQGENLRFVDVCWSGITQRHHEKVGETTKAWSSSLINRLKFRVSKEHIKPEKNSKPTQWIVDTMDTLQKGMLFVETLMGLRVPGVSNEIFGEFLGDVEMYGDFPYTRGQAVRLFHDTMAKIHQAHFDEFPNSVEPRYTIIAHSLGTVMTMDAISYAFANDDSRQSGFNDNNNKDIVHFPGYHDTNEKNVLPELHWVDHLCSYVTLGSPIDKYLSLWTENYLHLNSIEWMDQQRLSKRKNNKIRHLNYADEQDPVGLK
jgi:hypothetical protein